MKHLKHITLMSILSFSLIGCIGLYDFDPPDATHKYNYEGTWSGSLTEQATNPRSAQVSVTILPHNFSESSTDDWNGHYYNLKGTWSAAFGTASSTEFDSVGIFSGFADGYSTDFTASLTFGDDPNCSMSVNATRSGSSITGTYQPNYYENSACTFSDIKVGIFQITKQ